MHNQNRPVVINQQGDHFFPEPTNEERVLGMLIYLLNFFTAIIGPLIIWLIKRDESKYIDHHGREYFNLIISFFIYGVIASISLVILIGVLLVPIVSITFIVFVIIGAIKAYHGEYYRFPLIFRIL